MKNLKQNLAVILIAISSLSLQAQNSNGALKGQILNDEHEPVIGALVKILQAGSLVGGAATDADGMYTYKPLNAGTYDILVSSEGTQTKRVTNIRVSSEKTTYVDVAVSTNTLVEVVVVPHKENIIDNTFMHIKEISGEQLQVMAIERGNIMGAVTAISAEVTEDSEGEYHTRGGRGDATAYIVDGVKSPNITGVPALSIENLAIITGGIPAQYGDNTSGVIIVTTKDYFTGMQNKRIRDRYILEHKDRVKHEKEVIQNERNRKKQIEEELRLEEEAKANKG